MLQLCLVSNSLSHTTLSNLANKLRGIFFSRSLRSLLYIASLWFSINLHMTIQQEEPVCWIVKRLCQRRPRTAQWERTRQLVSGLGDRGSIPGYLGVVAIEKGSLLVALDYGRQLYLHRDTKMGWENRQGVGWVSQR